MEVRFLAVYPQLRILRHIGLVFAVFVQAFTAFSQVKTDSIAHQTKAYQQIASKKFDSLTSLASASRWRDSLLVSSWSGNLKKTIGHSFSTERITRITDSLRGIGLPEPAIARHADSLFRKKESLLNEASEQQVKLQKRITSRYEEWSSSLRTQFYLDSAGVRLPGLDKPGLPQVPNTGTPSIPGVNMHDIPTIPALEPLDFVSLGMSPELTSVGGSSAVPSTDQLGEWQKSIPAMPDPGGMVNEELNTIKGITTDPGAAAEKAAGQIAEMNDAAKGLRDAEQLKTNNEMLKTAEQIKDPNASMEMGKEQALDHFTGQEAALQGAMKQMAKYKQKYSSLGSLSEIKKNDWLPRNGLKGKPFRERFRLGLNLGYKGGDTLLFDLFPNASYRITGRIEAGLGAIYRIRLIQKPFGFDQHDPVWGMTSFVIVKTFKSVFIRVEMDGNSFPVSASADHPPYRDWRWSFYSGIQTNFKLSKRLTGNVQMLYSFDYSLKDKFPEQLRARVGVQYKLQMRNR